MLRWFADRWTAARREASVPPPPFKASKRAAVIMYGVWYGRLTPARAREKAAGWGFPPVAIEGMISEATQPPSYWSGHPPPVAPEDEIVFRAEGKMAEVGEAQLPIGVRLRFALFGLECALGVTLNGAECERVFRDAAADRVTGKAYRLFDSARLRVSAHVDESEPDSIRLRVGGDRGAAAALLRAVEGSEYHALRLSQSPGAVAAEPARAPDCGGGR